MKVTKETDIILYGASAAGIIGDHSLREINHYNVVGFLDLRGEEIKMQKGLPVWNLSSLSIPQEKRAFFLVVICVKNVFEHKKIVKNLIELGFRYFIFKIVNYCNLSINDINLINANYLNIFNDIDYSHKYQLDDVPKIESIKINEFKDFALIETDKGEVVANIPFSHVFCSSRISPKKEEELDIKEKSIYSLYAHIDLYDFFQGKGDTAEKYIDFCKQGAQSTSNTFGGNIKMTKSWEKNILANRNMIYDEMTYNLNCKPEFFIENCVKCEYEDGRFYMHSGKNRAAFLLSYHKRYLPLRIKSEHYKSFLNINCVNKIIDYIDKNNISILNAPIPHPYFFRMDSEKFNYYEVFASRVIRFLSEYYNLSYSNILQNMLPINILDLLNDNGAMARVLSANYYKVNKIYSNIEDLILFNLLDDLFYIDDIKYLNYVDLSVDYKIILLESDNFSIYLDNNKLENADVVVTISSKPNLSDAFVCQKNFYTYWNKGIAEVNIYARVRKDSTGML